VRARTTALLLVAVAAVLSAYLLVRAADLADEGPLGLLLGLGVLLLVVVGALLLGAEVRLGAASERLARRLDAEGLLVEPDGLERRPSGRLTPESAERLFALRKAEVEAAPEDWRRWWLLAAAYGESGDTSAGRRAMRKAAALERAQRTV
jgi:hypothetical protein